MAFYAELAKRWHSAGRRVGVCASIARCCEIKKILALHHGIHLDHDELLRLEYRLEEYWHDETMEAGRLVCFSQITDLKKKSRLMGEDCHLLIVESPLPGQEKNRFLIGDKPVIVVGTPLISTEPIDCPLCQEMGVAAPLWACIEKGAIAHRCTKACHKGSRFFARAPLQQNKEGKPIRIPPRTEQTYWTKQESKTAKDMRADNLTYREIARHLNRTEYSVISHLHKGGIDGTRKRQQRRAYLDQFDI